MIGPKILIGVLTVSALGGASGISYGMKTWPFNSEGKRENHGDSPKEVNSSSFEKNPNLLSEYIIKNLGKSKGSTSCYQQIITKSEEQNQEPNIEEKKVECESFWKRNGEEENKDYLKIRAKSEKIEEILSGYWEISKDKSENHWTVKVNTEKLGNISLECKRENISEKNLIEVLCVRKEENNAPLAQQNSIP
ncbi:hypothetical protein MSUIS_05270 [Mycoplasma suis KI3806]|uniref:Uncharacterized protein n=1 Tax=Mycoplasma suis (strain KI_3806) TaxID=708248 RepID=F0V1T9_MYCS3|nr:hypothetical protein [Mycoplasma suis]CBZ40620.1 hypothetical protein MSUIS_05270 [Mycoplasma suis KI3806]